jgi:hypothetical protein
MGEEKEKPETSQERGKRGVGWLQRKDETEIENRRERRGKERRKRRTERKLQLDMNGQTGNQSQVRQNEVREVRQVELQALW